MPAVFLRTITDVGGGAEGCCTLAGKALNLDDL